jgi:hypothetical protein
VSDAQALIEQLKAERAKKLAKAANGKAAAEVIAMRPASQEKPKRNKPKLEIATPKAFADDSRATPLERTIAALAKLDFTFTLRSVSPPIPHRRPRSAAADR